MSVRIEDLQKEGMKNGMIRFRSGQTVRVHRTIREGDKERVQIFEGLVIETKNQSNISASVTVRKIVGGIGVEQVFMVHSPLIQQIELVKEAKTRRSKLYFMRGLRGKAARLKERYFTDAEMQGMKSAALERDAAGIVEEESVEEAKSEASEPAVADEVVAEENAAPEVAEQKEEEKKES